MSMIFNGVIENFDTLFKQVETNVKNKKGDVFIDPDFLSENKEFRKLFSKGTGMNQEDFDFTDVKRERDLVIKFKSELIRKINSIIMKEKDSINLPYYQTIKSEIETQTDRYELEKINKELERKHDTFIRQNVENLIKETEIFLQEIKASSVFTQRAEFDYFVSLTDEIRMFLDFINLYSGVIKLFAEMKVTLPNYDIQKLITITKNIPNIDPNVPETIPGVKSLTVSVNLEEEMKKVLLFKSKNNSNNFGFEYDGHKYIINTVRNQNGKYIDINPQPYTGITFNDYYQKINKLEELNYAINNQNDEKEIIDSFEKFFENYDKTKLTNLVPDNLKAPVNNTDKIKFMSYNIMYNSNSLNQRNIIDLINNTKPDILALQEADWIIGSSEINLPDFTTSYKGDENPKNVKVITYFDPSKFKFLDSYDGSDIADKSIKKRGVIGLKLESLKNKNIVNIVNFHMAHYRDQIDTNTIEQITELRKTLLQEYLNKLNYKSGEKIILCGDSNEFYDEAVLKPEGIPVNELNKYPKNPFVLKLKDNTNVGIYFKDAENAFSCCNDEARPRNYTHRSDIIGTLDSNFIVHVPAFELEGEKENPRKWFSDHRSIVSYLDI